jgi:hypothetical protein
MGWMGSVGSDELVKLKRIKEVGRSSGRRGERATGRTPCVRQPSTRKRPLLPIPEGSDQYSHADVRTRRRPSVAGCAHVGVSGENALRGSTDR